MLSGLFMKMLTVSLLLLDGYWIACLHFSCTLVLVNMTYLACTSIFTVASNLLRYWSPKMNAVMIFLSSDYPVSPLILMISALDISSTLASGSLKTTLRPGWLIWMNGGIQISY